MKRVFSFILLLLVFLNSGLSQEHQDPAHQENDTAHTSMTHAFSRNLPMSRNGSGTSWTPDAAPVFGYMNHIGSWNYMLHGNLFVRYNNQDITNQGSRGGEMVDAPNWLMGMAQRQIGERHLLMLRSMISLEPITVGGEGYPLLFQTGETFQDKPLVDRQHPHDLFMELAAGYSFMINKNFDLMLYSGYPGEPALGPVTFMHRVSSFSNPDAPLGHHWQDATHISYGVITPGIRYKSFKLEGSIFNGREPDENRFKFDQPRFNSFSYRFSVNPGDFLSLQFSRSLLKSPEITAPEEDIIRTTSSLAYFYPISENSYVVSTLVTGTNDIGGFIKSSTLVEAHLQMKRIGFYGKYERVGKSNSDLQILQVEEERIFTINMVTAGAAFILFEQFDMRMSIGGQGSFYFTPPELKQLYGTNPLAVEVYLHLTPSTIKKLP